MSSKENMMYIKVINPKRSVLNEFNIYVNVVQHIEKYVIDTNNLAVVRETTAISLGFLTFTLTTTEDYNVRIKYFTEDEYCEKYADYNIHSFSHWLLYEKSRFLIGDVYVRIDKFLQTLDVYVPEGHCVYIDGKEYVKG